MRKYLIFDLDGLLFDSERPTLTQLQRALAQRGVEFADDDYRRCVGLAIDDMAAFFADRYHISDAKQMLIDVFDAVRFKNEGCPPPKAGALQLVNAAERMRLTMAIGTSSEHLIAMRFLRSANMERYFSVIVGGDQVTRRKPHPDIYLKALESLSARAEDAVALEDSYHGVSAAHSAGIRVILVPDLFSATSEILALCYTQYPSLHEVAANIEYVLGD